MSITVQSSSLVPTVAYHCTNCILHPNPCNCMRLIDYAIEKAKHWVYFRQQTSIFVLFCDADESLLTYGTSVSKHKIKKSKILNADHFKLRLCALSRSHSASSSRSNIFDSERLKKVVGLSVLPFVETVTAQSRYSSDHTTATFVLLERLWLITL